MEIKILLFIFTFFNFPLAHGDYAKTLTIKKSPHDFFQQGLQFYDKKNFTLAKDSFKQALQTLQQKGENVEYYPEVFYNLGLTEYRLDQKGSALFNFRMTAMTLPRNEDNQQNLEFISTRIGDKIGTTHISLANKLHQWVPFNLHELLYLFTLLNILFWLCFFLNKKFTKASLSVLYTLAGILSGTLFILILARISFPFQFGVIVVPESKIYSGPGTDNVVLFKLHEGTEFEIEETLKKEDWLRLRLNDGKSGWVNSHSTLASPQIF